MVLRPSGFAVLGLCPWSPALLVSPWCWFTSQRSCFPRMFLVAGIIHFQERMDPVQRIALVTERGCNEDLFEL